MEDLSKKKKLYEKLGALKFQKVVFFAEKLKFKIIDKFFPNITLRFNDHCDKKVEKLCKKNISEEEKNNIRFNYNCTKMTFRREILEKKNRNYHFNSSNAGNFYKYLLWNKNIHKNGMIRDIVLILLSILGICTFGGFFYVLSAMILIFSTIFLVIDFQCVNLQNYNLCRFEEKKELLTKLEERKRNRDLKKYSNVSYKVYEKLNSSVVIPPTSEVVKTLTTKEELEELRNLLLEIKHQRINDEENKEKVKIKGGN